MRNIVSEARYDPLNTLFSIQFKISIADQSTYRSSDVRGTLTPKSNALSHCEILSFRDNHKLPWQYYHLVQKAMLQREMVSQWDFP